MYHVGYHKGHRPSSIRKPPVEPATSITVQHNGVHHGYAYQDKGMAPEVPTTGIKQLETLTGVKVKRVRHDGAKKYVTNGLKAW